MYDQHRFGYGGDLKFSKIRHQPGHRGYLSVWQFYFLQHHGVAEAGQWFIGTLVTQADDLLKYQVMVCDACFYCDLFIRCLQDEDLDCLFTAPAQDRDLHTESRLETSETFDGPFQELLDAIVGQEFRRFLGRDSIG